MEEKKKKRMKYLGPAVIGLGIIGSIYLSFSASLNRIGGLLLEKDITQTRFTSKYVTKMIETELENVIANLQISQGAILDNYNMDSEALAEELKDLQAKLKFDKLGVCDLNGDGINGEGDVFQLKWPELLSAVSAGQYYISADVSEVDSIIMAVPVMREQIPAGVLLGHYQVERLAEAIDLNADSHLYFQIVDDSGRYISSSNNVNAFAREDDIWEELAKYQISDEITVEQIHQNVETGNSGFFHFTYQGQGRYVSYEPLGINNWYVFSTLVEEYVAGYIKEIDKICSMLIGELLAGLIVVFAFAGIGVYRTFVRLREQKEQLTTRNALLFMVLEYTNDIPFEIDFNKRTVSMYNMENQEQAVVRNLEEYFPDYLLEHQMLSKASDMVYRHIFNNMMHQQEMKPEVIRIRIEGRWQWVKVHYRIVNQSQLVGFLENYDEQIQQYKTIQEINQKSQLDSLTALYNRSYFKHQTEMAIERRRFSVKSGYSALFLLDLDYFKQANDTLGHIVGDEILKESAQAMRSSVRSTDLCGRLGGDEFVLFLENARDLESVQRCARKVNEAIRRTYGTGERKVTITASIGIAILTSETTFDELYRLADVALYRVKQSGRDGFYMISKDTEKKEETHHETEGDVQG